MLRVIREIKPTWVLGENVPGILRIAGKTVCEDLEREGYAVTVFNFEAAAVGAWHRRERVFFVGYSEHNGYFAQQELRSNEAASDKWRQKEQAQTGELTGASGPADVSSIRRSEGGSEWDDMEDTRRSLRQGGIIRGTDEDEVGEGDANIIKRPSSPSKLDVADTNTTGLQRRKETGNTCDGWENRNKLFAGCCDGEKRRPVESDVGGVASRLSYWLDGYWRVEPDIPRVATDVKNRVDRLKCLGNAVVPQQVYPILQAIAEIETR